MVHVEIRVVSDNKKANKDVINAIDSVLDKIDLEGVNIEFKNIRTRERKATVKPIETNSDPNPNGEEENPEGNQ